MKKIMFDNHFGLEDAVLNGTKTMTRRVIKDTNLKDGGSFSIVVDKNGEKHFSYLSKPCDKPGYNNVCSYRALKPQYHIGDVVAIAQSYESLIKDVYHGQEENFANRILEAHGKKKIAEVFGWTNKMYVRSDLMPHQIRITDIKIERLQNISDEDCLKEGVEKWMDSYIVPGIMEYRKKHNALFDTPKLAFAALIKKTCGTITWHQNPYVFVYTFELVR